MASPLTVKRNDYHANKKNSTIYTPVGVSQFLFDILARPTLHRAVDPGDEKLFTAFDPAIGSGILTDPWYQAGCRVLGCDIASFDGMIYCHDGMRGPFETCAWPPNWGRPDIVLCNPLCCPQHNGLVRIMSTRSLVPISVSLKARLLP